MGARLQGLGRSEGVSRRSVALAVGAAAVLALLPVGAAAQLPMNMSLGGGKRAPTAEELEKQRALDKAYKSAKEKIPEKSSAADPWGGIRPAPSASASAKKGKP
jgi:hypothetical protein